jgi:hypothetical protein
VPVDADQLPEDSNVLRQMIVDLARQLDKTQRLLQQLLVSCHIGS